MQELDDIGLLREYVERDSEEAFAALVERHINRVYSVALRHTGNPHQAEEITQAVFVILAGKSRQLSRGVILYSWLYKTARLAAAAFIRGEVRRTRREQEACMANLNETSEPEVWPQIAPLLDAALAALNETDRRALVLRFFYGKTMKEIGADLGANEDATKKRVDRALDKLQNYFSRRGVHSTTAMLAGTISAYSVQTAPVALAKSITAVALAKGATASISTLTLIKGALKIMAWTKAKTAVMVGAAILLAGGTAFVAVKNVRHAAGGYSWQVFDPAQAGTAIPQAPPKPGMPRMVSMAQGGSPKAPSLGDIALAGWILSNTPPQVTVVPTKFPKGGLVNGVRTWSWMAPFRNDQAIGMNCRADEIILYTMGSATKGTPSPVRMIVEAQTATNCYDFIANLPDGSRAALKVEVEQKIGLTGTFKSRLTDVLVLKAKTAAAGDDLRETRIAGTGASQLWAASTSDLAKAIEVFTRIPVVDETGLTNHFMLTLKWNEGDKPTGAEQLNQSLDKIGLGLVPASRSIEMLVVEKAN